MTLSPSSQSRLSVAKAKPIVASDRDEVAQIYLQHRPEKRASV
jgi:hypothetical protein